MGPLERCWPTRRPRASGAEPCPRPNAGARQATLDDMASASVRVQPRGLATVGGAVSIPPAGENHMRTPSRKLAVLVVATGFAALPAWAVATPDRTAHRVPADHHGHYGNYGHHGHHGHHRSAVLPAAV